ncbi:MAG: polysaccharide deacetylase family protein [Chitinophagaceae bacterium]|nr:polysaccharide deacetylase family protein [Chitinophagaceae bacterium]
MWYPVRTPALFRWIYPSLEWKGNAANKTIYLTFDDGPHPVATPFVLDLLKQYNIKATFFCIGKNVQRYPQIYQRILAEGHQTGNHTQDHRNGWKTSREDYLENIFTATQYIDASLFRPPYGRITRAQIKAVQQQFAYRIIMWDVLSGDFDTQLQPEQCWRQVKKAVRPGSIIVFHDSEKAWQRMQYALPRTIDHFLAQGYQFGLV